MSERDTHADLGVRNPPLPETLLLFPLAPGLHTPFPSSATLETCWGQRRLSEGNKRVSCKGDKNEDVWQL